MYDTKFTKYHTRKNMIKKFGLLALIQLCNSFAANILLVMLTALIYKGHGNIAVLMLLMTIPTILFSSFFGRLIDKNDAKRVLLLLLFILLIIIALLLSRKLYGYNWVLYVFAFSVYSTDYLIRLYLQVSVTGLTSHHHYLKFNSVINLIENIGIVIGPVLGGIWIQKDDLDFGFLMIGLLFIFISGSVFYLKQAHNSAINDSGQLNHSYDGCILFLNHPKDKLRTMYFIISIFSFAMGLINVRQISFVITHYHVAELGYSITESLWGLGMVIGCFLVVVLDRKSPIHSLVGCNCILLGASVVFLVINHTYSLAFVLFLILGIGNMIISIGFTTIIQKISDKNNMGKSLGMKNLWQQTAVLISMGFAGLFETSISSEFLYFLAGILLIAGGTFTFYAWKQWGGKV